MFYNSISVLILCVLIQVNLFAANKLVDGGRYNIRVPSGKYLSYDETNGTLFLADVSQKTPIMLLKRGADNLFLKFSNNKYLGVWSNGALFISDQPKDWETFTVEEANNDKFYLKSHLNSYLSTNTRGDELKSSEKNDQAVLEFIELSNTDNLVNNSSYYIKGPENSYISFTGNTFRMGNFHQRTPFKITKNNDDRVFFQLPDNRYLGAHILGGVHIGQEPKEWEAFDILERKDGKFYIKSFHKNYLSADTNRRGLDLSFDKADNQLFGLVSELPKIIHVSDSSRVDLYSKNIDLLKSNVANMDNMHWTRNGRIQKMFNAAIDHYQNVIVKQFGNENIVVAHNDNYDIPSEHLRVQDIYKTKVVPTSAWMVYSSNKIVAAHSGLIVTYLDYANASLAGHVFGGGYAQEETMFALCSDLALYASGNGLKASMIEDSKLTHDVFKPFTTRSTREISITSPRPKYIVNVRCGVNEEQNRELTFNDNPPLINILALAAPEPSRAGLKKGDSYNIELLTDFFNNVYKAFELVQEYNKIYRPGSGNLIIGGRLGAGVFGNSILMSAAMQIIAARLLGIDELVLTAAGRENVYEEAISTVNAFLTEEKIGWKFSKLLEHFLELVKDKDEWKVRS